MFASSIVYYLLIKKAQLQKIPEKIYMVANFAVPQLLYVVIVIQSGTSIMISPLLVFYILLFRVSFGYIGSTLSYTAMKNAPNAGYSLVIQKSMAILTTFVDIFLLQGEVSIRKIISIGFVLFCTTVLSIQQNVIDKKKSYQWVFQSLFVMFCFSMVVLSGKFIIRMGVAVPVFLFWSNGMILLLSIIDYFRIRKSISYKLTTQHILILFGFGVAVSIFYYSKQIAEVIAPNIGYVNALNAASNAVYTLIVAYLFKDSLSYKKFLAVIGITIGLIAIIL
jgi:hypothetical protein